MVAVSPVQGFTTEKIDQDPTNLVTVNGIPTPVDGFTTRHGTDQPIGSASLTLPADGDLSHLDLNATLEIQAGYTDRPTSRVFAGRIVDIDRTLDASGRTIRVQAEDNTQQLNWETESDWTFPGAITLQGIFRSVVEQRGLALFRADQVLYPTSATHVTFGGITEIDGGGVVIKRRTSPLQWLTNKASLFGYRVFGTPDGTTRLQRVSGLPASSPVATFTEGLDIFQVSHSRSTKPMVTNWTVYGASYTDSDGVPVEIRAIPSVVPAEPYLTPPGWRSGDVSDPILTTQALVDAVRNVMEIDHSEASEIATWETWGRPDIQPGDVIGIVSGSVGIPVLSTRWVTGVDHHWSERGFTTTLTAWAGSGEQLAAGIDEKIISIGSGVYRLGDEWLPHYVHTAPGGEQVTVPFTVPGTYTSLALRGRAHGSNSYLIDGANAESSVSKLEVWQNGERVGTADFPMMPENLQYAYDYDNDVYWDDFRMPVPGKLTPGGAELRIIAGKDNRISAAYTIDDFEVKNLAIEARGTGNAVLPGVG